MLPGIIRFAKYSLVGGTTFALDLGLLYLFIDVFGLHYIFSTALAFGIAVSINYFVSRRFVFAGSERSAASGYVYFIAIALIGMTLVVGLMTLFVEYFDLNPFLSRAIIAAIVGMWNYMMNLFVNFRVAGMH